LLKKTKSLRESYAPSLETAPRKQRAKEAAARRLVESSAPEKNLGKIWDHWAVKANSWIDTHIESIAHMDGVVDLFLCKPPGSAATTKEEEERKRRLRKARRQQEKLMDHLSASFFGPGKTQEQLAEERRDEEEAALQEAQLARLQEKFAGRLTLL
jgi:hypothetical protein